MLTQHPLATNGTKGFLWHAAFVKNARAFKPFFALSVIHSLLLLSFLPGQILLPRLFATYLALDNVPRQEGQWACDGRRDGGTR